MSFSHVALAPIVTYRFDRPSSFGKMLTNWKPQHVGRCSHGPTGIEHPRPTASTNPRMTKLFF